jgi:hypothetical protein
MPSVGRDLPPGSYLRLRDEPNSYAATFRVLSGPSRGLGREVLDEITDAVGVSPLDGALARGRWCVRSEAFVGSERPLDEHLTALLDRIEPGAEPLGRVLDRHGLAADFFCGLWMGRYNTGLGLRPQTLARIAGLNARLEIDIYASRDYDDVVKLA